MPLVSLVVPCHNEAESLPLLFKELEKVAGEMSAQYDDLSFEVVAVDDGSKDDTLQVLKEHSAIQARNSVFQLRWLSFSRNFGKEAALYAGLRNAQGDYVATMDADMQDPPALLPEMYGLLLNGECDNVATYRSTRKGEPVVRSAFANLFYKVINCLSTTEVPNGARDFRLMNRKMVDAIVSMGEYNRFSKGIYGWVGFKTKWIAYENVERVAGKSNWSFLSLFSYSVDGIVAFSTKPLSIASVAGIMLCLVALVAMLVIVVRTLAFGDPVAGWPSLACIVLFVGGLQLLCLGIMGQYLAKLYLETKRRPLYLVSESSAEESR